MLRGNAKIAELVGARLRTLLGRVGDEPILNELHTLLHELDVRAAWEPSRYVSLSERLEKLKKVD